MNKLVKLYLAGLVTAIFMVPAAWAGNVTIPNNFTSGTPAVAAEVNSNFGAVETEVDDNDGRITTNTGDISNMQNSLSKLGQIVTMGASLSDLCTGAAGSFYECGNVTVTVPAGATARVTINSKVGVYESSAAQRVTACIAIRLASDPVLTSCQNTNAWAVLDVGIAQFSFAPIDFSTTLAGGADYVITTLVNPNGSTLNFLSGLDVARVTTLVTVTDDSALLGTLSAGGVSVSAQEAVGR